MTTHVRKGWGTGETPEIVETHYVRK